MVEPDFEEALIQFLDGQFGCHDDGLYRNDF
jgi:hypothetical protein